MNRRGFLGAISIAPIALFPGTRHEPQERVAQPPARKHERLRQFQAGEMLLTSDMNTIVNRINELTDYEV